MTQLNFVYPYDMSLACWATDYLMFIGSLYNCKTLLNRYRSRLQDIIKKKDLKISNEKLSRQKLVIALNICYVFLLGLSGLFGGIKHQFFYKGEHYIGRVLWFFACITSSSLSPVCIMTPFLTLKALSKKGRNLIVSCVILFSGMLAIEEFIYEKITLGGILLGSVLVMTIISLISTVLYSCGDDQIIRFRKSRYFPGTIFLTSFAFWYTSIYPVCSQPSAFEKGCPVPDWFNHNALLHIVIFISFTLMSRAYIKVF